MRPKLTHSIMDLIAPGCCRLRAGQGTVCHTRDQVSAAPVASDFFHPPPCSPEHLQETSSWPLTPDEIFIQSIAREHFPLTVLLTWKCSYAKWARKLLQTLNPHLTAGKSVQGGEREGNGGHTASGAPSPPHCAWHACTVANGPAHAHTIIATARDPGLLWTPFKFNSRNCPEAARSTPYSHSTLLKENFGLLVDRPTNNCSMSLLGYSMAFFPLVEPRKPSESFLTLPNPQGSGL